jgi:hypothetical protein
MFGWRLRDERRKGMLEIEEIKKACKFAEGFEYLGKGKIISPNCRMRTIKQFQCTEEVYPLFLQRIIEGINKPFCIQYVEYSQNGLSVDMCKGSKIYFGYDIYSIDQAKEQAIKYILDKL